jgi:hypothetical protein
MLGRSDHRVFLSFLGLRIDGSGLSWAPQGPFALLQHIMAFTADHEFDSRLLAIQVEDAIV